MPEAPAKGADCRDGGDNHAKRTANRIDEIADPEGLPTDHEGGCQGRDEIKPINRKFEREDVPHYAGKDRLLERVLIVPQIDFKAVALRRSSAVDRVGKEAATCRYPYTDQQG